jgi:hypothetical protein
MACREGGARHRFSRWRGCSRVVDPNSIGSYGPGNVFEALVAQVVEGQIEAVADMVADCGRDANPARLGQASSRAATFTPSP